MKSSGEERSLGRRDIASLKCELEELRREREHLASLSAERALTAFEENRVEQIRDEMCYRIRLVVQTGREGAIPVL